MAIYNAITGQRRREALVCLARKNRGTMSSTVAARMYAGFAMEAFNAYMHGAERGFRTLFLMMQNGNVPEHIIQYVMTTVIGFAHHAVEMIRLDSTLLDLPAGVQSGYSKPLIDLTIDDYFVNDDQSREFTRFTKDQLHYLVADLNLLEYVRVRYETNKGPKYFRFRVETLFIYVLRKLSTGATHKHLSDVEFGGDSGRWGRGYTFMIMYLDDRYSSIIGPQGVETWAPHFPYFAEINREAFMRDKVHRDADGNVTRLMSIQHNNIQPGEFNIFGYTDATVYEICRPGSGPTSGGEGAPRREGWYHKQRAFYDGYHHGMEASCKILTILLPNGLSIIYGPTSARQDDRTLFRLSEFDEVLTELGQQLHGGNLYCAYGDGIFGGYWNCLRSRHIAPPNMPLTEAQHEENKHMCSLRESVEWSYARAEALWPFLNTKAQKKIDRGGDKVFAEIRVAYFLCNVAVCTNEGSTMTGTRGFQCPPPSMEDYLAMRT